MYALALYSKRTLFQEYLPGNDPVKPRVVNQAIKRHDMFTLSVENSRISNG